MAQWPGTHISSMQLFYALKQKCPNIPDHLVSHCIQKAEGDEKACLDLLESPQFSCYRTGRMSVFHGDDKSRDETGAAALAAPKTACSITRRVPPPSQVTTSSYLQYNKGISVLIQAQLQRKKNLELEVEKDKRKLHEMEKRQDELKLLLRSNTASYRVYSGRFAGPKPASSAQTPLSQNSVIKQTASGRKNNNIQELNEEIKGLRQDCIKLYKELDSAVDVSLVRMKPISVRTELTANGKEMLLQLWANR